MKHIVFDGRQLYTSSGRYANELLNHLQKIDHKHRYTVLLNAEDYKTWQSSNPNFTGVCAPYKEFTFGEQLGLYKQIKNLHPDLVYFPYAQQPILYRGNVVTTIQDLTTLRFRNPAKNWLVFTIKQQIFKWVHKIIIHKSRLLTTLTKFGRNDVATFGGVSIDKIVVCYPAPGLFPFPAKPLPRLKNKEFIVYQGRPQPHKNLWRAIEAFRLVQRDHPNLIFVLVGKKDAAYDLIEERVKKEGIKNVWFVGFQPDQVSRWLFTNSRVYVSPSLSEGFGMNPLEAMGCGAPVVASDINCIPEVLGDAALYFDPYSPEDIAKAINRLLTEPKLREKLIRHGEKQFAKYSWDRCARQIVDVFARALGEK